jgi:hypothetical protein
MSRIGAYLFTSASEALDYGTSQLKREGCLWGFGTGDGVARTVWTADHACCVFLLLRVLCAGVKR